MVIWCPRFVFSCSKSKIRSCHCSEHLIAWSFEFMALCSLVGSYHVWGTAASTCSVATSQTSAITQKKSSPLTMEAAISSKTMVVTCWATYCNIPEVFYPKNQGIRFLQHVGSPTVSCDLISQKKWSLLKIEVTIFSETLVTTYQTTWCNNPQVLWPSRWKQQIHVKCWKPTYQITVIQNNSSTLKMETFSSSIYQVSQCNNLEVFYLEDESTCLPQENGNQPTRLHCVKMQQLPALQIHLASSSKILIPGVW